MLIMFFDLPSQPQFENPSYRIRYAAAVSPASLFISDRQRVDTAYIYVFESYDRKTNNSSLNNSNGMKRENKIIFWTTFFYFRLLRILNFYCHCNSAT